MRPLSVSQILHPGSFQEFVESTWGKQYRHIPGQPGKFADLLPWSRFNALLQEHCFDPERLHLVKERGVVPPPVYRCRGVDGEPKPHLDPVKVNQLIREGATLIVNGMDEMVDSVRELAESLQRSLFKRVAISAFASWGTTAGFGLRPHADEIDVFIFQVAGRKRWMLFGEAPEAPGATHADDHAEATEPPVWDQILEDGDLLYIPRGWKHAVVPIDEPSLHLTAACYRNTGIEYLRWLQDELRVSPVFRQELPRFGTQQERVEHMSRLRAELLAMLDEQALERYFLLNDAEALPHPRFSLPWSAMPEALPATDGALVRLTSPRRVTVRLGADPQMIELLANGERWQFSRQVHDLLHVLIDGQPHSIGELCDSTGDALDRGRVRSFLSELLLQGLIAVVEEPCLPLALDEAAD
jgi:ribosomal protein L16 Arg81 hydroxylase